MENNDIYFDWNKIPEVRNRVLVSMAEGLDEPEWFSEIEILVKKILAKMDCEEEEVSIMFCDDKMIQQLNKEYRDIDSPTDVLSFENGDEYEDEEGHWYCTGDIIISLETLPKNAAYFEVSENEELKRLLVHGILHILGFDHGEEHIEKGMEPQCEMLQIQENMLELMKDIVIIK